MTVLRLVYLDENKKEKTVPMEENIFIIGRDPKSDLAVPDTRLSREHLKIERFGEVYIAKDCGSSNGTIHNGKKLEDPVAVADGDKFDLGGGLEVQAILKADDKDSPNAEPEAAAPAASPPADQSPPPGSSISPAVFLLIPAAGIVLLLAIGGIFLLIRDTGGTVIASDDPDYSSTTSDSDSSSTEKDPTPKTEKSPGTTSVPTVAPSTENPTGDSTSNGGDTQPTTVSPESNAAAMVEVNGSAFLRSIAQNDPRAFLTGEQSEIVSKKIKQVGSSALADNINSARKNSAKIGQIATAKNLKPQILATAAITKLGNQRGDVVQAAQAMAETLSVMCTQVGNEFGDDVLMAVAAYDQGSAGDTMKLRNKLQDLTTKLPESARTIRSIWFLKKNGTITEQEFDFALRFLAIGTITQNPKAFNVNAEPLKL